MSEWISVDDKLPDVGSWSICFSKVVTGEGTTSSGQVEILFLDGMSPVFWLNNGDWEHEVTHWMPLPDDPNGVPRET
jgi:hypothetical protein